ncbi:MAG: group 1 truncated hemoglobin [Candidatus Omnitrophica bacterium]|nr:group 1 truncated hemoglobin [Candidatus Omnitrophota bacterium]MCA9416893.1 group 1 truncated hemoglobin [Candidatus Omnitrophota bacterium]MCA9424155.1 group 1 truncated hemoglobin [Candidatus Omnitrophota bacterium]MCA9428887.1 group 1 truncated hemoglobin [Candidatus Omnitrophota bacterium]MCA9435562.1 group 1 truncated hemoglobin [Candidatus Omnitrophota bacterium]
MTQTTTVTLYEKLGGQAAVDAAVDRFYKKVLEDDRINGFFDGIDMDAQIAKQKAFMTMAFGGPHDYTGKDMRIGHAHLVAQGLDDEHFDAVAEDLKTTLEEMGVPGDYIVEVLALVETTRDDVLNR